MSAEPTPASAFRSIPLSDLRESKLNPRRHFDSVKLEELAASIRSHGVITPVLVRAVNGHFEIAAGHRRFRAAKLAGVAEVPAVVRELDDVAFLEVLTIENLQREDVHPLEEAEGYRSLMQHGKYDAETIAAKVGKSVSYVYQRLKLAELIEPAKKAFLENQISAGHAILLARLQPKDQAEALSPAAGLKQYQHRAFSVREFAQWIDENFHLDLHSAPWKKDDAALLPVAGACVSCPKRTGFNKALFEDLAKKDLCTDRECFQSKGAAFIAQRAVELGPETVKISTGYSYGEEKQLKKAGILAQGEYRDAGNKACANTVTALIAHVDRHQKGALGHTKKVCTSKNCKTHRDRYSYSAPPVSAAEKKRRAEEAQKAKLLSLVGRAAVTAILAKVKAPLGRGELRLLVQTSERFEYMDKETSKTLSELVGIDPGKPKAIENATDNQIAKLLIWAMLEDDFLGRQHYGHGPRALPIAAKLFGVDLKKLEAEAKATTSHASAKKAKGKK